jgi:hypothetical protein
VQVVEDNGVNGKTVIVTRTVKKGSSVVRTDSFKSVYKPKSEVVRVGSKSAGSKAATSTVSPKKN